MIASAGVNNVLLCSEIAFSGNTRAFEVGLMPAWRSFAMICRSLKTPIKTATMELTAKQTYETICAVVTGLFERAQLVCNLACQSRPLF